MAVELYSLEDAREQLQVLLDVGQPAVAPDPKLRATLDDTTPRLLSAGVMQYADVLVWYSLTAQRDADDLQSVGFELELSTDSEIPPALCVVCQIGRSRVEQPVDHSTTLAWRATVTEVLNKRSKRVDAVTISLTQPAA